MTVLVSEGLVAALPAATTTPPGGRHPARKTVAGEGGEAAGTQPAGWLITTSEISTGSLAPGARSRLVWSGAARTAAAVIAAGALTLLGTGVAAAHVTAEPGTAIKGGYTVVSFRVPSELPTAGTVKLEVTLPADHPIASARTTPMAGWTAEIIKAPLSPPVREHDTTITEAVRSITWTAAPGVRLGPTEFADFRVSMGRLPRDVDQLVMPAVQTYDDGTVVRWDEPQAPGAEEPEHPAPTLRLVADESSAVSAGEAAARAAAGTGRADDAHQGAQDGHGASQGASPVDSTARWLGGSGLLVGALALGVAGMVLRGRRSR